MLHSPCWRPSCGVQSCNRGAEVPGRVRQPQLVAPHLSMTNQFQKAEVVDRKIRKIQGI